MSNKYLKGNGIYLIPIEEEDASTLKEMKNDEFIREMMSSTLPVTLEDVQADINNTKKSASPYFLICKEIEENENKDIAIGFVKLEIISSIIRASEIHIGIMKEYTGNGFGKQVINLITEYAFNNLNIHSIRALIREKNYASQKAFEKQGYKKVGVLPEWSFYGGEYHDCYIYVCIPRFRENI